MTFSRSSSSLIPGPEAGSPEPDAVGILFDSHDPAAGELALGLQIDRALLFQNLERPRPELQPQNVPFPRQQVVIHIQPRHRLQMASDDAIGDELGDERRVASAVLDVVQRRGADLQSLFVLLVPLRDARVEVPAVIVEARGVGYSTDVVEVLCSSSLNPTTTSATCTPVSSM